ncbi:MAG: polysaccharide biosynthesis protein, partial [Candidatus Omnitrophica bacterium]|nr:polysaccharide biosynthesis protein [Candidatus Omnitrophota bacterium]
QNVRSVIIALSKISREEIQQIVKTCQQFHLECRIVPQTSYLWSSPTLPLELREVDISDLLGREIIRIDGKEMQEYFGDKKILITGAGGSIGSEFVKMLFQAHPRELLLVDNCEHNLYEIQQGFAEHLADTKVIGYLCDVTHRQELEKIFKRHRPDIVYHAAAYKHVPTLEYYYTQGIYNNILGTKIAADLALEYHVGCFVLISSDKAIRPTSMMGATKRVAELYTQSLGGGATRFISVRFGNVLNSKGSVVPLFKKQFEAGIALTVTDPEATRYFMDVSEAVCLILQATLLGSDSEIFVLDMGKPIKIIDLAQAIAQLMGISSDKVPIKFIGLRPGEKLKEEIQLESEQAIPTRHKKIKIWRTVNGSGSIGKAVEELLGLVNQGALREEVIQRLKQMIPEYQPWFPQETVCVGIKQEPPVSVENNAF